MIHWPLPIRLPVASGLALLAAGCSAPVNVELEAEGLMEASRSWSRTAQSGDIEAMLEHWTEDAVILSSGETELRGKAAIRESLQASFALPGFRISWEPLRAEVSRSGDLGYVLERIEMRVTGPDGRPLAQSWRGLTIWRKGPDGKWLNSLEMTNIPPRG